MQPEHRKDYVQQEIEDQPLSSVSLYRDRLARVTVLLRTISYLSHQGHAFTRSM